MNHYDHNSLEFRYSEKSSVLASTIKEKVVLTVPTGPIMGVKNKPLWEKVGNNGVVKSGESIIPIIKLN